MILALLLGLNYNGFVSEKSIWRNLNLLNFSFKYYSIYFYFFKIQLSSRLDFFSTNNEDGLIAK